MQLLHKNTNHKDNAAHIPHPYAHTPAQTRSTQSLSPLDTYPTTMQFHEIIFKWDQPSSTSRCADQCTSANTAYTGQGTSMYMSMCQHAQGHLLTTAWKTKNNIVRMKQTAVLEKDLRFV